MKPAELQLGDVAVVDYVQQLGHADLPAYQEWYGLKPDNIVGPITSSLLAEPRCGVPDFAGAEKAQIPRECMEVSVTYDFDSIDAEIAAAAWKLATDKWNEFCGITMNLSKGTGGTIWATDGPLPGSTLAWSFLPTDRCDERMEQRYDTTISYVIEFLAKIILHELGHGAGLRHTNSRLDIMFASIGPAPLNSYPSEADIRRMVQRYGDPTEPPPPPPPGKPKVIFEFTAKEAGQKFALLTGADPDDGWEI